MANNCYYYMLIKGSQENCNKWLSKMRSYDEENHFFRIFNADILNEEFDGNQYGLYISGDCAWSIESCCRASGYSDGVDLFEVNTKELNLVMEVYSEESGMGFQEHYIYDKGVCVVDEVESFIEYWWDKDECPTFCDFRNQYDLNISLSDLDDSGEYYKLGGFGDWDFSI